ncbi:unnamed protein product [Callosobruchus maculatus]|uniref:Uncharacterized protein n=1 Tax=Callosobruchus maculatus TaxID=64391 RepID=A0A653BID9_CALMS|nr:unnamed protein product [Callosobruchus maculatus]
MNKIQSAVLAVVMSVFLIQATDPPYEKPTGSFIQFYPVRQRRIDNVEPKYTQVFFNAQRSIGSFASQNALDSNQKPIQSTTPGNYVPSSLVPQRSTITNFLSGSNLPLYPPLVPIPQAPSQGPSTSESDQKFAESALPQYPPVRLQFDVSKVPEAPQNRYDALGRLHNYLSKIGDSRDRSGQPDEDKSAYEKLLDKEFIRPLLKLYEKQIHYQPDYEIANGNSTGRISKEDYVEDFKVLSKDELEMLMYGGEKYQANQNHDAENQQNLDTGNDSVSSASEGNTSTNGIRRDDVSVPENNDKEHIGEILPPEFKKTQQAYPQTHRRVYHQIIFNPANYRMRKSYDYNDRAEIPRIPLTFPTAPSSEGLDGAGYHRVPRINLPPPELYRAPRRFRGYRESFNEGPPHPYFDPSARYHNGWTARRPRVIFPTDLVAFRDATNNQEQEPDWLAGDNNLQDIQEPDVRDRVYSPQCLLGASCEFFLSCWMSGGLLDEPCGLLRGCCHYRGVAKRDESSGLAIGTLHAPPERAKSDDGPFDAVRCGISSTQNQGAQRRIVGGEEAGFGTFHGKPILG